MRSVAVIGASLAGVRAAETLRQEGFDGTITVVGDESHRPYDRPPLSKQVLAGEWEPDRIALPVGAADVGGAGGDLAIDWRLGCRATALDLEAQTVALSDGSMLGFDGLVIATGAAARSLPGTGTTVGAGAVQAGAGVHTLRTLDDCLALRADLDATPSRVVVVGAGFIGAEVAATCRGRGVAVTMVEPLPVPLARVLGKRIGGVCGDLHRDHGVDLRLGVGVDGLHLDGRGRVRAVVLADGSQVAADVVVVGIGVIPSTAWLQGSGVMIGDGVVCDETCLAAPGVVAAGDVARWPNPRFGESMRVEHWDNALAQGAHAARRLLADWAASTSPGPGAGGEPFAPVPWFWSDQYDCKFQLAGRCRPDDEVRVVDGTLADRRFVALYGRGGRVVAALGCNRPAVVMRYRRLIADGLAWDDPQAAGSSGPG